MHPSTSEVPSDSDADNCIPTGDGNAKVVVVLLANVLDKVQRAAVAAVNSLPLLLARRRIAAKRNNIANSNLLGSLESNINLFLGHVGAGQVHVGVDVELLVHLGAQFHGQFGR
eukprot:TRINITY_DN8723_c0_g1_i2.p4 TRINITY_DN8723_c0_g1~~TRINITY_DN8723_c0_g1_i2.p4  ORF type:complete len:114 (-),score=11.54 TRINITY_DN8723_c0_g1_i2:274-615(-)